MKRPLTLVIAAATAALAIAPLGIGTQAQAQIDVYIGKQKQPEQGQLPPSTGSYGDRDRDNYDNRRGDYDNRRGDRYDQYGTRVRLRKEARPITFGRAANTGHALLSFDPGQNGSGWANAEGRQ